MRLSGDQHAEGTKCHVLSCRESLQCSEAPRATFPVFLIPDILGHAGERPPGAGQHGRGSLPGGRGGFPGRAVPRAGQAPLLGPALPHCGPRRRQRQPGNRPCLGVFVSEAAPRGTPCPQLPLLVSSKIDYISIRRAAPCFYKIWVQEESTPAWNGNREKISTKWPQNLLLNNARSITSVTMKRFTRRQSTLTKAILRSSGQQMRYPAESDSCWSWDLRVNPFVSIVLHVLSPFP